MSKFIHGPSMAGQSVVDRVLAAKHTVAGQSLAKVTCKATTEEVMGPKRKHLDYLLQCTNEPNVSVPEMANLLIERTQNTNWVVVFKALITVHNLMNYGNERFTQYLASNNCTFNLTSFTDRTGTQGYDMSSYIRRYAKYLNEKAFSYRQMAFDFCKVKRGKEDGMLRTMNTEKLLKTLPVLQSQLDALVEFDVTANELTNGVINAAFMLLFKDLIRLFACYNDGVINLLEKYFEMNKKNCREALDIYKKFLARMDRVCEFLKVAESVGIDKGDIPDLAKAPASLLEALEQHLASLESSKKGTNTAPPKPASGVSTVISNYAAAAQIGAAPGAGAGVTHISDEERQRILEEEQRQLDQMKHSISSSVYSTTEQQRMKQMAASSSSSSPANASSSASKQTTSSNKVSSPSRPSDHLTSVGNNSSGPSLADDLFSLSAAPPQQQSAPFGSSSSFGASASLDSMFITSSAPAPQLSYSANPSPMFGSSAAFQPSPFGNSSAFAAPVQTSNPFVTAPAPVMVMPQTWGSPAFMGTQGSMMAGQSIATPNHAGIDAKFAAAFSNSSSSSTQKTGYDVSVRSCSRWVLVAGRSTCRAACHPGVVWAAGSVVNRTPPPAVQTSSSNLISTAASRFSQATSAFGPVAKSKRPTTSGLGRLVKSG